MDPKVSITETDPVSDGAIVRGFIASDVWLNCYVENLPPEFQVTSTLYLQSELLLIQILSTWKKLPFTSINCLF